MLYLCQIKDRYQRNISFRYLSIASIFLIVIQLTFGMTQGYRLYEQRVNHLRTKVNSKLKLVQAIAAQDIIKSENRLLAKVLTDINKDRDIIYSVIVDREQKLIAYSLNPENSIVQLTLKNPGNHNISLEELQEIRNHRSISEAQDNIYLDNNILGEVWIGYSLINARQDLLKMEANNLMTAIIIGILFAGMTHLIFAQEILDPIKKLKALAKDIAEGRLGKPVTIFREDEIGELSSALNIMAWQLQQNLNQLKIARDEALIAEKAKSQFISQMSHELRTPLNAIIGFTQIMQQDPQITAKHQEYISIIEQNSLHLLTLINDLLKMAPIDSSKSSFNNTTFNLYTFLRSLEQVFIFKAKAKEIRLLFKYGAEIPQYIKTDEEKLRQILFTLLDNSIKSNKQGTITLTIKGKTDPENEYDYILYFKITDTGTGISSENIDNLFLDFPQAKNKASNEIGLALAMTKQLVELIGGDIEIKSQINQGTVVRFFIPIIDPDISEINTKQFTSNESKQPEPDSIESQFFYNRSSSYQLTDAKLADMKLEWLLALQDATSKVDNELILQILEQIPADYEDLRQALLDLVEDFSYDSILELTDKALSKIDN